MLNAVSAPQTNISPQQGAVASCEPEVLDFKPRVFTVGELSTMNLPPIEWLMSPLVPQKGISMIAAPRGAGKSFLAMAIAIAAASGFGFLGFAADTPRRVLYVDGEMNGRTLQDRFNSLIAGFESEGKTVIKENLFIYGCDFQGTNPMPDFANKDSQEAFERTLHSIGNVDLIIIDNVFTLYGCDDENNASKWQPFNQWCVEQRKNNRAVLWIHHTGKKVDNGGRGSSAIETLMDSSLLLTRPKGYSSNLGAVIIGKYTKSRSVAGDAVADFAAKLTGNKDCLQWAPADVEQPDSDVVKIRELYEGGNTIEQIAQITGISKTTVHRKIQAAGITRGSPANDNVAPAAVAAQEPENNSNQLDLFDGVVHEMDLSQIPDDLPF